MVILTLGMSQKLPSGRPANQVDEDMLKGFYDCAFPLDGIQVQHLPFFLIIPHKDTKADFRAVSESNKNDR